MWFCLRCGREVAVSYVQVAGVVDYGDGEYEVVHWGDYVEPPECCECGSREVEER